MDGMGLNVPSWDILFEISSKIHLALSEWWCYKVQGPVHSLQNTKSMWILLTKWEVSCWIAFEESWGYLYWFTWRPVLTDPQTKTVKCLFMFFFFFVLKHKGWKTSKRFLIFCLCNTVALEDKWPLKKVEVTSSPLHNCPKSSG